MLAANVITRRIHRVWTEKVEAHKQGKGQAPPQLMITIEEAHKFLNPRAANQTIFGTIARELRKYNVTLLVVDQRPSGIDDEVLSQIGTRITCALNDDKDIDATLAGVSGASHLRAILAGLDSRQQAMILGHAVPMPMALADPLVRRNVLRMGRARPPAAARRAHHPGWHRAATRSPPPSSRCAATRSCSATMTDLSPAPYAGRGAMPAPLPAYGEGAEG